MLQCMIQDYCTMYVVLGRIISMVLRNTQPGDVTQDCLVQFFESVAVAIQESREQLRFLMFAVKSRKYDFV